MVERTRMKKIKLKMEKVQVVDKSRRSPIYLFASNKKSRFSRAKKKIENVDESTKLQLVINYSLVIITQS